jgi:hypothetical protein
MISSTAYQKDKAFIINDSFLETSWLDHPAQKGLQGVTALIQIHCIYIYIYIYIYERCLESKKGAKLLQANKITQAKPH